MYTSLEPRLVQTNTGHTIASCTPWKSRSLPNGDSNTSNVAKRLISPPNKFPSVIVPVKNSGLDEYVRQPCGLPRLKARALVVNGERTQALLKWPHHPTQHYLKTHPARHPGGQEKTPWRAREDTLEGKRRHPGGQEKTPWRARVDTMKGKRRHHGGQEKTPWRAREDTMEGKRRHPEGQEKTPWRAREDTLKGKRRHPGGQEKTGPPEERLTG